MAGPIAEEVRRSLERWLAEASGAERVAVEDAERLGGGAISLNVGAALAVTGGPFDGRHAVVVRVGPTAGMAASLDKRQEFRVLCAAHDAGVAVPEPLFACDDDSVLGSPFYVMRRAAGVAAGRLVVKTEAPQRELARELGRQLGRLHRVRPDEDGLDLPVPHGPPALEAVRAFRTWIGLEADRDPVLAWGLRWLQVNAPEDGEVVLCHRDYRTGNYLVEAGRLTAILDWEFAGWSDPMEDLGWFCARSWRFGRTEREAGGIADRADFYAGYEETAGRPIDAARVAYWEAAAYLRWAAIAIMQGRRHTCGVEPSLELALTGRMVPEIERDLLIHLRAIDGGMPR